MERCGVLALLLDGVVSVSASAVMLEASDVDILMEEEMEEEKGEGEEDMFTSVSFEVLSSCCGTGVEPPDTDVEPPDT